MKEVDGLCTRTILHHKKFLELDPDSGHRGDLVGNHATTRAASCMHDQMVMTITAWIIMAAATIVVH